MKNKKNPHRKRLRELGDILRFYGAHHPRHKAALKEVDEILGMPSEPESEAHDGTDGTDPDLYSDES